MKRVFIIEAIAFANVFLFVYAAVSKILDYEKFSVELGKSPLLNAFAVPVAVGVPVVEIAIAAMLLIPRFRMLGLYASFTLMVLFTAYIVAIMNFSFYVPCSCGGILQSMGWKEHLLFNIGFVVLNVIGVLAQTKEQKAPAVTIKTI